MLSVWVCVSLCVCGGVSGHMCACPGRERVLLLGTGRRGRWVDLLAAFGGLWQGCPGPGAPMSRPELLCSGCLSRFPLPALLSHCPPPSRPPGLPVFLFPTLLLRLSVPISPSVSPSFFSPLRSWRRPCQAFLADAAQLSPELRLPSCEPVCVRRPLGRLLPSSLTRLPITPFYGVSMSVSRQ